MKSKVASSWTLRARSLRKMAAPLSTPTKITACPEKSRVISAPIAATRCAICSREIRTLSSVTANYIKLALGIWHLAFGGRRLLPNPARPFRGQEPIAKCWHQAQHYESQRHQTHLVRPRDVSV